MQATIPLGPQADGSLPIPLYVQVRELLRARIQAEEPKVGEQLPSEADLCSRYGVSRTVVRQALDDLVREGLIQKHRGRGAIVRSAQIEERLGTLKSFTEEMQAQGLRPGIRPLHERWEAPPPEASAALGLPAGEHAYVIERLRLADDEPIAWELTVWPAALMRRLQAHDLATAIFYRLLEGELGIPLGIAEQTLTAVAAPTAVARVLGVARGSPLLTVERLTVSASGQPLLWGRTLYRADRYRYRVRLQRQPARVSLLSPL